MPLVYRIFQCLTSGSIIQRGMSLNGERDSNGV